ncbi:MAG: hypothetical protein AB1896_11170 [Thermodesulfobacteriota bacterium]
MIRKKRSRPPARPFAGMALLVLAVLILCPGCPGEYIPSGPIINTFDSAVPDAEAKKLNLKLLGFDWRYLQRTDQVKVWGSVQNLTEENIQSCRIIIEAYDQFDYMLGSMETFLTPTFIGPDQKAGLEVFFQNGQWVKNLRLVYHFEIRN